MVATASRVCTRRPGVVVLSVLCWELRGCMRGGGSGRSYCQQAERDGAHELADGHELGHFPSTRSCLLSVLDVFSALPNLRGAVVAVRQR